jgi:UDP-N-acetylmuramate--alanine ligase
MSSLAHMALENGYLVRGSDRTEGALTRALSDAGADMRYGHCAENLENCDAFVYTVAISPDNPEYVRAGEMGIPRISRADFLGYVMTSRHMRIGVCGTHGKTTVTSMITQILHQDGQDPSAVIGGYLKAIEGYGRAGSGNHLVCESCEYNDTFLKLSPDTCLLLNIDRDHLEYFKTVENLKASFRKFAEKSSMIICNGP